MKEGLFELLPKWVMYDQFWRTLKKRNLWLIELRYIAVFMLFLLSIASVFEKNFHSQTLPLFLLSAGILGYNVLFKRLAQHVPDGFAKFHGLHFALIQMSADFIALMVLAYYTGGVESPFLLFFIFHVIIGSLLLPMRIVSLLISSAMIITLCGALFEASGIIPHQHFGFELNRQFSDQWYIATHFILLTLTLFISNYLANSISKELYVRERSLTVAYHKLEEAEQAKSRYVMSVVHDLKTPIAAAITYLNMLLDGSLGKVPEAFERPLERSRIRLNNAISVVNDILQLTQLKLAAKPVITEVNLTELIEEIYQEMRILFVAKRIRFSSWTNAKDDILIHAEQKLLKLALANLISNTHKYTDSDGRVEIHIKRLDDKVAIEIADSGMGIPKSEQEKIFQDFYRSAGAKKKGIEGTGLGLSVVLHIISQFSGTLSVESPSRLADGADHPGTAFTILLPIVYVPREAEGDFGVPLNN